MKPEFWFELSDDALARGMPDLAQAYLVAALRQGEFSMRAADCNFDRLCRELKAMAESGEIAFGRMSVPKFKGGGIVNGKR